MRCPSTRQGMRLPVCWLPAPSVLDCPGAWALYGHIVLMRGENWPTVNEGCHVSGNIWFWLICQRTQARNFSANYNCKITNPRLRFALYMKKAASSSFTAEGKSQVCS